MVDGRKKKKKDGQLLIRIPVADRDDFVTLCGELDTTAAREIRRFIRQFVENKGKNQGESR